MNFSRSNPSPRYVELQTLYRSMHEEGERFLCIPPGKTFPGNSLLAQARRIKRLVERTSAGTILDYGSGKGLQYDPMPFKDEAGQVWPGVMEFWDVDEVVCYDPCYAPFNRLPVGRFDGVISTDVLEHCPEPDLAWIVDEIFGYATKFIFANIACYPARKRLANGENAHCTIKPVGWWRDLFERAAAARGPVAWEVWIQSHAETPQGLRLIEERLGNA